MGSEPLISVIIPVYKTEKYIDRCVESVVSQTYKNLEIILVDDGSPDRCPQICDEWASKDSRVKVIHKENGGLSDARNAALDVMKGDFVTFIDSDDWVSLRYCELLYTYLIRGKCNICVCGYLRTDASSGNTESYSEKIDVLDSKRALSELFGANNIKFVTAWGKLYRADLFEGIYFPVGKYHEDDFTTYKLYDRAVSVCETDDILYYYFKNDESIISKYNIKRLDSIEAQYEKYLFVKSNYPDLEGDALGTYFSTCRYQFQMLCYHNELDPDREHRKKILDLVNNIDKSSIIGRYNGKQLFWVKAFYRAPYLTSRIRNMFKIGW